VLGVNPYGRGLELMVYSTAVWSGQKEVRKGGWCVDLIHKHLIWLDKFIASSFGAGLKDSFQA
jgi:hypothetical protein